MIASAYRWSRIRTLATTIRIAMPNREHYVDLAAGLADDLKALAALRGRLRADMQRSPRLDHCRFAADLENIFRMMWPLGSTASNEPR